MSERFLRIAALYERDDCVQINGQWHVPLTGLGEVLAEFGLKIQDVTGSHGARRDPATAGDAAHETAPGRSSAEGV